MTVNIIDNNTVNTMLIDSEYERKVWDIIRAFNDDIAPFMLQLQDCIILEGMQCYTNNLQHKHENPITIDHTHNVNVRAVKPGYLRDIHRINLGDKSPVLCMPTVNWTDSDGYRYSATIHQEFLNVNGCDYTIPDDIIALSQIYI